jgi:hypothetical protein
VIRFFDTSENPTRLQGTFADDVRIIGESFVRLLPWLEHPHPFRLLRDSWS